MTDKIFKGMLIVGAMTLVALFVWLAVEIFGGNANRKPGVTRSEMRRLQHRYYELRVKKMERDLGEKP